MVNMIEELPREIVLYGLKYELVGYSNNCSHCAEENPMFRSNRSRTEHLDKEFMKQTTRFSTWMLWSILHVYV